MCVSRFSSGASHQALNHFQCKSLGTLVIINPVQTDIFSLLLFESKKHDTIEDKDTKNYLKLRSLT